MSALDRLSKVFAGLLATTAVGCQGQEDDIDLLQFDENICDEDGWHPLRALEPAEAVEYVELRAIEENLFGPEDADNFGEPRILDADGERCGGASDVAACEAAFEALGYESQILGGSFFGETQTHRTLAFTRGDSAQVLVSVAEVRDFLGDIDSAGDAALWANLQGHRIVCEGDDDVGAHARGFVVHTRSGDGCPSDIKENVVLVRPDGSIEVLQSVVVEEGDPGCAVGRIPGGLCNRGESLASNPIGRYLASAAELEAASVPAFEQLTDELRAHGAPSSMLDGARAARRDEVRHARTMARLAARHGARVRVPRVRRMPIKDMVAMAADNVAEGCVRETFGALVAHVQARRAQDPAVRAALRTIAHDETRHAALSWRIARWADSRMRRAERAQVRQSARASIARLGEELTAQQDPRVHAVLGLPNRRDAKALFAGLHSGLLRELERA